MAGQTINNVNSSVNKIEPAKLKSRPYKDYLTPVLHRSFTNAALFGFGICWIIAIFMSKPDLIWSWFPFGKTGLKTTFLFLSCLSILILRIATLHVDQKINPSPIYGLLSIIKGKRAIQTFIWYLISSLIFCEVYISGVKKTAKLSWIDQGKSYERPRINERAVLFRSLFLILSLAQSCLHLYQQYDVINLKSFTTKNDRERNMNNKQIIKSTWSKIKEGMVKCLINSLGLLLSVIALGPILYYSTIRYTAWTLSNSVTKIFFTLHKSNIPQGSGSISTLLLRFIYSASLLLILWQLINLIFTIYLQQEPIKKDKTLSEDSKDSNGTLISGLKSRKNYIKTIAFWELDIISKRFQDRRRTIYTDGERLEVITWPSILQICSKEIENISQAIKNNQPHNIQQQQNNNNKSSNEHLIPAKHKIVQPLKENDAIYGSTTTKSLSSFDTLTTEVGTLAKSIGQHTINSKQQSPFQIVKNKTIPSKIQHEIPKTKQSITKSFNNYIVTFLKSPIGYLFRQTYSRKILSMLFSIQDSNQFIIQKAISSLSMLTIKSLKEDRLGQVQKDIPRIIKLFSTTIKDVEDFINHTKPHWTDVYFDEKREKNIDQVDDLINELKYGLEGIINVFGEYYDALGMTKLEMDNVRRIVVSQK